jgi:hypothetical protein
MYVNTFEFYKIEKFKKHLDFNLLYNKIKEELKEHFKTSCLDWDNYTWIDTIMEAFTNNQYQYMVEVYSIDVDVTFQENVDEVNYIGMEFYSFLEELYNTQNSTSETNNI